MKPLRWLTNKESHGYMRVRQDENKERCRLSKAEAWMNGMLCSTGMKWTRQAVWGYRIFDFWCAKIGCAVEVDGPEHDRQYDRYRDEYNFRRSGIVVLRVRNFNVDDAEKAFTVIMALGSWCDRRVAVGADGSDKKAPLAKKKFKSSKLDEYVEMVYRNATKMPRMAIAYDDMGSAGTARTRDYNPRLYGFPRGTLWPITVEDAQAGRHRQEGVEWDAVLDELSIGGTLDAHEESTPNNQTDDAGV